MPKEYAIYLRKSRADIEAEQRGEGETLARHQRTLLDLADKLGLNVTRIYHEVVSGETISARPEMQQLLSDVEKGLWAGVLVMEVERLARGETIDQGTVQRSFMYSSTKIITPMKIYDPNDEYDQEYFEFGLFMSRREYKTINRRMQRGRVASVQEGKYVGNKAPYGYRRVKLEHEKGWTLEPIPEEAAVVRTIFDWYINGVEENDRQRLGMSLICRRLNNMGVPAATGGPWVPATLQNMMRNPVYAGFVRWNARATVKKFVDGEIVKERPRAKNAATFPGRHQAIIPPDVFRSAQALISRNSSHPAPSQSPVKNPLSGLVVCGCCGRKMVRRPYPSGYPDTLMCPLSGCPTVSAHLELVEKRVLEGIAQWVDGYKLKWADADAPEDGAQLELLRTSLRKADELRATLETQRGSLHDLLEQGVYTVDTFLSRSKELSARATEAEAEVQRLGRLLSDAELALANKTNAIPKAERLLDTYDTLCSANAKNIILKEVISKIVYTKEKGGRWHGSPDDFNITIYPRLSDDVFYTHH